MVDWISQIDQDIFLAINGANNTLFDSIMFWASCKYIWIPLYLVFISLLYKKYGKKVFILIGAAIFLVFISDQTSVSLFKNVFQRLRPCHEPGLSGMVHLVKDHCGGSFGFISSHASNTFAVAVFITGLVGKQHKWLLPVVIFWAFLVAYSRVYLGTHYPGDVICGALWGSFLGVLVWRISRNLI